MEGEAKVAGYHRGYARKPLELGWTLGLGAERSVYTMFNI